jgi:hypothetical protein
MNFDELDFCRRVAVKIKFKTDLFVELDFPKIKYRSKDFSVLFCLHKSSDIYSLLNFRQKTHPPLLDDSTPARSKLWMRFAVYMFACVTGSTTKMWPTHPARPTISRSTYMAKMTIHIVHTCQSI